MKKNLFLIVLLIFLWVFFLRDLNQIDIIYPETKISLQEDDYHGILVKDPYRWLEDMESDEVKDWIYEQQSLTESYFDQISFIDQIEKRLKERWNYPRMTTPFHRDNRYFFYKNTGFQNH